MYEVLENGSIKQNVAFLHTQVVYFFYKDLQPTEALGFNTLFTQYYSVICHPSDQPVGRPRAEIRTQDGR